MKKKVMAMALGITMALTMAACGNGNGQTASSAASQTAVESAAESAAESSGNSESSPESTEKAVGGWETNEGSTDPDASSNKAAKEAFEKAVKDLDGYDYKLVACLGSQVVSGTNYSYLVKRTPVTPDAEGTFCLVTVYENLDGNAEITDAADVDLSADAYVTSSASDTESVTLTDSAA